MVSGRMEQHQLSYRCAAWTMALLLSVLAAAASAQQVPPPAAIAQPAISRVTPSRLEVGRNYTLTITGSGFVAGMTASLAPAGVRITGPVMVQGPNSARLSVQVAVGAAAGFRRLELSMPTASTDAYAIRAVPGPPLRVVLPRAIEVMAGAATAPQPDRHSTVGGAGGELLPPQVSPASPTGAGDAAMPGRMLPAGIARVTQMSPASGEPGASYVLELRGFSLQQDTRFSLGSDIEATGPPAFLGSARVRLPIRVRETAAPGPRRLRLASGAQGAWVDQSVQFVVAAKKAARIPVAAMPVPQIAALDTVSVVKDRIELQTPDWKVQAGSRPPLQDPVTGELLRGPEPLWQLDLPGLREDMLFSWKETSHGVAEWFEIRFYRKDQLVASRSIEAVSVSIGRQKTSFLPTWFRADAQLLAQLLEPRQPPAAPAEGPRPLLDLKTAGMSAVAEQPAIEQQAAMLADLYWEVAGFRRFRSDGVAKSALLESETVDEPARILVAAVGDPPAVAAQAGPVIRSVDSPVVAGPETVVEVELSERWPLATPFHPTGLGCGEDIKGRFDLVNLSKEGFAGNQAYDVMRLTGSFSLEKSPYAAKPATSKTRIRRQEHAWYEPPSQEETVRSTTWSFDNLFVDWGDGTQQPFSASVAGDAGEYVATAPLSLGEQGWTHRYQEPGQYVVRVYQLPSDAVQAGGSQLLPAALGERQGAYFKTLQYDDHLIQAEQQLAAGRQVASGGYMLFCQNVVVSPRSDSDASGPLKLVKIEVQGFPWEQPQTASPQEGQSLASATPARGPAAASLVGDARSQTAGGGPTFSSCDIETTAGAALSYVGQGSASLRWRLDGAVFHEEVYDDIGPSPPRPEETLAKNPAGWGKPLTGVRRNLLSAAIPLDSPASHQLSVEAEALYTGREPGLFDAIAQALGAGGREADAATAKAVLLGLQDGPRIGLLTPYAQATAGLPAVSYVHEALVQVAGVVEPLSLAATIQLPSVTTIDTALGRVAGSLLPDKAPPEFVESAPASFRIVGHDSAEACSFDFAVTDGSFRIGGLQGVTRRGDLYSGEGTLRLPVPGQPGKHLPVPISFQQWHLADDGVTVEQGSFEVGEVPGGEHTAAGLAYTIGKLEGTAGQSLEATLDARLARGDLLLAADATPAVLPPTAASLSPTGDWHAEAVPLGELLLHDSGFLLAPKAVTLDLSTAVGEAPDASCSATAAGWMGVHLGSGAVLTAYDFDLPGTSTTTVDNFGIDAAGLCGEAQLGPFAARQLRGEFRWDGIDVAAGKGQFSARYRNLRVKVPWLDTELKGAQDPLLRTGAGQAALSLNLTGGPVRRQHGNLELFAQDLRLVKLEGMVPAVRSNTRFDFRAEGKPFASDIWVHDLYFGLDGKAYLEPGTSSLRLGLAGRTSSIGQAKLTLQDVRVHVPGGDQRLGFEFAGTASLSKALEAVRMTVDYMVVEPAENRYTAAGPLAGTAEPLSVSFPRAEGTIKGKIRANYEGAPAAAGALAFRGSVDMHMFALPMTAAFGLGYQGSNDFWAIKAVHDGFGPNGAPLITPFLNLFEVGGGLGYNVSLESLKGRALDALGYAAGGGVPVFNASTMVGTIDGFTLGLRGELSIKVAGDAPGTRMDFQAYPLTPSNGWQARPPFEGFMKYQGGGFDGELWGEMSFLAGAAEVKVPRGAAQLHFGSGDWYAYLGRESGPRVQGRVLFIDQDAYLMLSPAKMAMGGSAAMDESLGNCKNLCAYVSGRADAGLGLSTAPLKLAGNTKVKLKAGGCLKNRCTGVSGRVSAYGEVPGPVMRYGFMIDLPCPLPDVDITLKVLPSPGLSPSLDSCLW